ncbi:MAG: CYTH domain-containing protein [Candidatus Pacebacteria bacterium]|nr:CYTH domain-containing protein [Candidatus Paceibacterota bacterium]
MNTQEIECRFLEIDKDVLLKKLHALGALDEGEELVNEVIIYDKELKWRDEQRFLRVRKIGDKTTLAYKEQTQHTVDGTYELELNIDDYEKAILLFEKIGLYPFRYNQKKRHTFKLNKVTIDIDTWPMIPAYVELEGDSEQDLKDVAKMLELDWKEADFHGARWVIEHKYKIPVGTFRWFTFDKCE